MASFFVAIFFSITAPLHTLYISAFTLPDTSASPSQSWHLWKLFFYCKNRIGSEQNAGRLRKNHLLNNHGQLHLAMIEPILNAVNDGSFGEQRSPAFC